MVKICKKSYFLFRNSSKKTVLSFFPLAKIIILEFFFFENENEGYDMQNLHHFFATT